ncbi:MAG TPA: head-tail connector protein [Stellaceae bacterium]
MAYGDLTTLADVKAWLQTGQSAFPITDDALLTRLITAASQFIESWLNRRIVQSDYIEVRDGTGGRRMQFGSFPVSAVISLTIDDIAIPPSTSTRTAGYVFSPTQLAVRGFYFTRRPQNVVVVYTAGYSPVPPEIAQACIELVALRYRDRTRIGEVSRALTSGETVTYSQQDLSNPVRAMLQQYRAVAPATFYPPMAAATATDAATVAGAL